MSARLSTDLPIEPLVPEILGALKVAPNLVLEAPPGAGKTTRVPLALLDADWAKGGKIIVATYNNEIAGTVALKFVDPKTYEFTKMAVDSKFRGMKVGQALGEEAISKAKSLGADKIILYSHTVLVPAVTLYKKLGFVEVPVDGPYKRSNIKMELKLV